MDTELRDEHLTRHMALILVGELVQQEPGNFDNQAGSNRKQEAAVKF